MNTKLLLPHKFKRIGWFILIPAIILGIIIMITGFDTIELVVPVFALINDDDLGIMSTKYFTISEKNIVPTLTGIFFIIGALLVGFSKEKREDEFIANLRLSSLLWAVWANYILLFFAFLFVYGFSFLLVMIYNMFTVLIIFIVRFNYILFKNSKAAMHEK